MRRIINGKSYNTDTAECVATWSNRYYPNDFKYCEESLYKTAKGSWFIAGEGGAMSKYRTQYGNSYGGGEGLEPITEDQARQWLEEHNFVDELEEHFSESIEEA